MSRSSRKRSKIDPIVKLALSIVPAAQVANGSFREVNVANRTEADQRHSVRSRETRTIRRLTVIERLVVRGTISRRQGAICQWYADQHEMGFATTRCTHNYSGTGGGNGFGIDSLLAHSAEQERARTNYSIARNALDPILRPLFERVVLEKLSLGEAGCRDRYSRLSSSFKRAVDQLDDAISHMVAIDD